MATTTRGYRYPGVNDAPDGPYSFQTGFEDVDADVALQDARLDKLPVKMESGAGSIFIGAAVNFATVTVTLPAGFTVAPNVVATLTTATTGRASLISLVITNITTTSFVARIYTSDNANTGTSYTLGFNWVAVQS